MAISARRYPARVRHRAEMMRRRGYTYAEICGRLDHIPKGTLAHWLKNIPLTPQHAARIRAKIIASARRGRPLALAAWDQKMRRWRGQIEARVASFGILPYRSRTVGKLVCGIMYLCEGARYPTSRQLTFGNSNPQIVKAFLSLLRQHFHVDEQRLRARVMHRWDQNGRTLTRFWSHVTMIPEEQFYRSYRDRRTRLRPTRRSNYYGVCAVHYGDTELQYELQAIGMSVLNGQSA